MVGTLQVSRALANRHDMARRLPNNELVIYPDAGHAGIFQFHEQFVEKALEFLAK
jgi:pimeloyl-ACP methyl ester carboxylesterase